MIDDKPQAEALKLCPWCGCEDVEPDCFDRNEAGACTEPAVCCNGCGVIVQFDFEAEQPWAEIRRRWNARAALEPSEDMVERVATILEGPLPTGSTKALARAIIKALETKDGG